MCSGDLASIVSTDPSPGYTVQRAMLGPAHYVQVFFVSAGNTSQISARCDQSSNVVATVTEKPGPPAPPTH
jgi:hypothetical protein